MAAEKEGRVPVTRLTEERIRRMPLGSGIHRDEVVKGLMVLCHRSCKTYSVQGDVRRNGRHVRTVRVKIDRCDRISLAEARRQAKALMSTIQSGIDPTAKAPETGVTVEQAIEAHISERDLRERTVHEYRYLLGKYLGGLRRRAVADIGRQDVRELAETLSRRSGRTTAASVMRVLRLAINTAMRLDETIGSNPVDSLRMPAPGSRTVKELDLAEWWRKTEELSPLMRDLHRTILLTGARRSSVLRVRRDDFDAQSAILAFNHMKTRGQLLYPVGNWLASMLRARLDEDEKVGSPWLWPSRTSASGHVEEPKVRGMPSPHVLRHHNRTLAIAASVPYAESALLLGQRLPGASGGYVHPQHLVEYLRPHAQAVEDLILGAAGIPS